jgi:hypothetical protein
MVVLVVFVMVACGGSNGATDTGRVDPGYSLDLSGYDDHVDSETSLGDEGRDQVAVDVPVTDDLVSVDVPPEPGQFGYPCTDNVQCNSGFCVDSPGGRVCSRICVASCPTDWVCKPISSSGETVQICVPLFLNLCDPCEITKDCNGELTGGLAICVNKGADGSFCGADCGAAGACPSGFECKDQDDGAGGVSRQCVPVENGQCQCSPRAITMGLQTECFQVGDGGGLCMGLRKCLLGGLTVCDARDRKSVV